MKIKIRIQNCSIEKMSITKEPEAVESLIDPKDEIEIVTNAQEENISINVGKNEDGTIYVQIWDALNTRYAVFYEGKDMFEKYL